MNPVNFANLARLAILNELIATGNFLDGAKVHCYKTPVALSPLTVLADLDECDFSGYAASSTVVWSAAFISPQGVPTIEGGAKLFQTSSTPTVFNTVYGWYATDTGGTTLLCARQFDTPVVLSVPSQGYVVIPSVPSFLPN